MTDPAQKRFFAIGLIRLSGAAFVMLALLILNGNIAMPKAAGWIFLALGLFDVFVMPVFLARRWRSRDE